MLHIRHINRSVGVGKVWFYAATWIALKIDPIHTAFFVLYFRFSLRSV